MENFRKRFVWGSKCVEWKENGEVSPTMFVWQSLCVMSREWRSKTQHVCVAVLVCYARRMENGKALPFSILHSPFSILHSSFPLATKKKAGLSPDPFVFCFTKVNYFTLVESSAPALKRTTFLALI